MARAKEGKKKKKAYLTKRALVRATRKATRSLASEAMNIKGYIVKAEKGWVVKVHHTGEEERLSPLNHSSRIALD